MKKFFAILAAACMLAIGNVFANTWTSPNDQTAYFTLGVFCEPTLTGGTGVDLGHYFTNSTITSFVNSTTQTWYLTGPTIASGASYAVQGSGFTGDLPDNATTATTSLITATGGTGGNSTLSGNWILPDLHTNGSPVNCTADNTNTAIQFVVTQLNTVGTGTQTFSITLNVTVHV
jgi:hypothetical protein